MVLVHPHFPDRNTTLSWEERNAWRRTKSIPNGQTQNQKVHWFQVLVNLMIFDAILIKHQPRNVVSHYQWFLEHPKHLQPWSLWPWRSLRGHLAHLQTSSRCWEKDILQIWWIRSASKHRFRRSRVWFCSVVLILCVVFEGLSKWEGRCLLISASYWALMNVCYCILIGPTSVTRVKWYQGLSKFSVYHRTQQCHRSNGWQSREFASDFRSNITSGFQGGAIL